MPEIGALKASGRSTVLGNAISSDSRVFGWSRNATQITRPSSAGDKVEQARAFVRRQMDVQNAHSTHCGQLQLG
jgi:hypothetical protein